ncbi:MAG: response regulator, partial [Myxococcota bacterium]
CILVLAPDGGGLRVELANRAARRELGEAPTVDALPAGLVDACQRATPERPIVRTLPSGRVVHVECADGRCVASWAPSAEAQPSADGEARFRALAENIAQLAWMADATGWIYWYNQRWYEFTGTTLEQMQGWGWRDVHHPDHVDRVVVRVQHAWDTGEPWEDTFPLRRHDGVYRWFLSRALPIRDDQGRVVQWFGTNTDITEQRESQRALEEADRRKDEFLAVLAHELRNPLAPVRTAVQVLGRADAGAGDKERAREMVDRQVRHMVRLVDDLLDVSRITRGKLELQRVRVGLGEVVEQAVEAARPQLEGAGLTLTYTPPAAPVAVDADPVRLGQVVSNLLDNARKFAPGGTVAVVARVEPGEAVVEVADDGVGLSPDDLGELFEMFSQVGARREGLGIGLALSRQLVALHGGTLRAHSAGLGQGSRFEIRLPTARGGLEAAELPTAPSDGAHRRILVVDDNLDAAASLSMLLELAGYEVREAHDGLEAVAAAADQRFDAVLLDLGMPRLDGIGACRRIRATPEGQGLWIAALTGWGAEADRRRTAEAGFDEHLVKPVDPDHLLRLLDQALGPTMADGAAT